MKRTVGRLSGGLSALLLAVLVAAVLVGLGACSIDGPGGAPAEQRYDPNDGEATVAEYSPPIDFDRHDVLSDLELTDYLAMNAAEVQAFLEQTPYGWTSVLAGHMTGGVSAAQAMVDAAHSYHINPLVILTRVQLEQSLIGKQSASAKALDWAMGCGCPDNAPCNTAYQGFGKQIDCMASKFRSYLDDMQNGGSTIAGWAVGKTKTTLDGYAVTPVNQATAAIYTYTPWVSSAKNHAKIFALYASYVGYAPGQNGSGGAGGAGGAGGGNGDGGAGGGGDGGAGGAGGGDSGAGGSAPPPPSSWIVDSDPAANGTDTAFEASSNWTASSATPGHYGSDYRYRSTGQSSDLARFRLYLSAPRTVSVEAWWTAGQNRSSHAPFLIYDGDGQHLATTYVDQSAQGSQWVPLGTFDLSAGWNEVALSRWTSGGKVVIADAVRLTAVP